MVVTSIVSSSVIFITVFWKAVIAFSGSPITRQFRGTSVDLLHQRRLGTYPNNIIHLVDGATTFDVYFATPEIIYSNHYSIRDFNGEGACIMTSPRSAREVLRSLVFGGLKYLVVL